MNPKDPDEREGGCLCGAVRYRLNAAPLSVRICWCRVCQRIAGNGTVNAVVQSQTLEISGEPAEHVLKADSGNDVRRRFCALCGTQLFSNSSGRPGFTVVRVGTLDDPSSVTPTTNIWTASAPNWAHLDPAMDNCAQQPPAPPASPPA